MKFVFEVINKEDLTKEDLYYLRKTMVEFELKINSSTGFRTHVNEEDKE